MSDVGSRIRYLRESRNWTLRDLAEITGLTYSMLGHVERGTREGTAETIKKIAEAFSISPGVLIDTNLDLDRAADFSRIADGVSHLDDRQVSVILDMIDTLRASK